MARVVAPVHLLEHAVRARLHGQMHEGRELGERAMRVDEPLRHVDGMARRVAQARELIEGAEPLEKPFERRRAPRFVLARVGVDVLPDQRDLAHAGVDEPARFLEHMLDLAGDFGAARIGHDAKRAEFVATFLHGDEGRDAARRDLRARGRRERLKFLFDREIRVGDARALAGFLKQRRQAVIALRTDDEVHGALAAHDELALGLRDAAGHDDLEVFALGAALLLEHGEATELRIDFLGGLLADVAGVEDDELGVLLARGFRVTLLRQEIRHPRGVIDVHLAAVGPHQRFGLAPAAPRGDVLRGFANLSGSCEVSARDQS